MKYHIHNRNETMKGLGDEAAVKEMTMANAKDFSKIKDLYAKLQPTEDNQSQLVHAVSKQLQDRKVIKKASVQQAQGKARLNTDFMQHLTTSLQQSQRASQKAMMERTRSDEREEQEEQRQAQR